MCHVKVVLERILEGLVEGCVWWDDRGSRGGMKRGWMPGDEWDRRLVGAVYKGMKWKSIGWGRCCGVGMRLVELGGSSSLWEFRSGTFLL